MLASTLYTGLNGRWVVYIQKGLRVIHMCSFDNRRGSVKPVLDSEAWLMKLSYAKPNCTVWHRKLGVTWLVICGSWFVGSLAKAISVSKSKEFGSCTFGICSVVKTSEVKPYAVWHAWYGEPTQITSQVPPSDTGLRFLRADKDFCPAVYFDVSKYYYFFFKYVNKSKLFII